MERDGERDDLPVSLPITFLIVLQIALCSHGHILSLPPPIALHLFDDTFNLAVKKYWLDWRQNNVRTENNGPFVRSIWFERGLRTYYTMSQVNLVILSCFREATSQLPEALRGKLGKFISFAVNKSVNVSWASPYWRKCCIRGTDENTKLDQTQIWVCLSRECIKLPRLKFSAFLFTAKFV